ncbi:MAG: VOC family protein [Halanaerobiales bacterium]|nr:VOC family protein [Halanaerobiales bacterium]
MEFLFNTIEVSDLEKSFEFYKNVIGLELARRIKPQEGMEIIFLEDEKGHTVELLDYKEQKIEDKAGKLNIKMGFAVDDLDKTIKFLNKKGIDIIEGPVPIENGRFVDITDPDGIKIGLYDFE